MTCAEKQYLAAYLREAAADGAEVAPEKLARAADALEAGLAETARIDALALGMACGQEVILDGRGSCVRIAFWRQADGCLDHCASGPTLRDAIDDAMNARGGGPCEE